MPCSTAATLLLSAAVQPSVSIKDAAASVESVLDLQGLQVSSSYCSLNNKDVCLVLTTNGNKSEYVVSMKEFCSKTVGACLDAIS
jgi:hypothetical protein